MGDNLMVPEFLEIYQTIKAGKLSKYSSCQFLQSLYRPRLCNMQCTYYYRAADFPPGQVCTPAEIEPAQLVRQPSLYPAKIEPAQFVPSQFVPGRD